MSILDLKLEDAPKREILPAGERLLRIESEEVKQGPKVQYINMRMSAPDNPAADAVWHRVNLPTFREEDKQYDIMAVENLEDFITGFKIPYNGKKLDTAVFVGCQGWCSIKHEEYQGKTKAVIDSVIRSA